MDIALKLQSEGFLEVKLHNKSDIPFVIDIRDYLNRNNAIFIQLTWIPNEINKSNLVLFSMIDRVMNHLGIF